jgi:AAA domain
MPTAIEISSESASEVLDRCGFGPEPTPQPSQVQDRESGRFDVRAWLAEHGLRVKCEKIDCDGHKLVLEECPFNPDHKAPDAAVIVRSSGQIGFHCFHNSCRDYGWRDLRKRYEPLAYSRSHTIGLGSNDFGWSPRPPVAYQRITAAELDAATYELEYLIEGTMTAGQPLIVAGSKKNLKTNILLDLVVSLASATPFLGSLQIHRPARSAIMSGESGLHTIQETCRRICRAKGIELRELSRLIVSPDLPRIDDIRYLTALDEFIRADDIEVLVLDPAYLCMPGDDAGNLFKQGELLRGLAGVCQQNGVTLVLCHHTKKSITDPFAPPELEHIAWAGFQEFARQWWLLGRRAKFEPGSGYHQLWFNVGGAAGHSALWALDIREGVYDGVTPRIWDVTLQTASTARETAAEEREASRNVAREQKHRAKVDAAKQRIVRVLQDVDKHADTKRNIQSRAGMKGAIFDDAFFELLRAGTLIPCEIERANGKQYDGFRYVSDQPTCDSSGDCAD